MGSPGTCTPTAPLGEEVEGDMAPLVYAFTVDHNGEGLLPLELRAPRVLLGLALLTRRWRCGGGAAKGGALAGSRARSLHFRCGASWSPPFSRNEKYEHLEHVR